MSKLRQVFHLIDQPYKFTKGNYAIDRKGNFIDPNDTKAVARDILGALLKTYGYTPSYEGVECVTYPPQGYEEEVDVLTKLAHKAFPLYKNYSLGPINDMMSYDEVLELFGLLFYVIDLDE